MSDVKDILSIHKQPLSSSVSSNTHSSLTAQQHFKRRSAVDSAAIAAAGGASATDGGAGGGAGGSSGASFMLFSSHRNRELSSLDSSTTLVPAHSQGWKARRSAASHWYHLPIRSSARVSTQLSGRSTDDVDLNHWVKVVSVPDFRFARFNKKVKILLYSDEEYDQHLQNPKWTRAQTDTLMDLAQTFDLRFIVMHDRFEENVQTMETVENDSSSSSLSSPSTFTVEDLKERYYSIQRTLLAIRNSADPDLKSHPQFQNVFDANYESERKKQLSKLCQRTQRQIDEMAQYVIEHRKLTTAIKKIKKIAKEQKRAAITQELTNRGHAGQTGQFAAPGTPVSSSMAMGLKRKKGQNRLSTSGPLAPSPVLSPSSLGLAGVSSLPGFGAPLAADGSQLPLAPIPAECIPTALFPDRADGVYLRSSEAAQQPQVSAKISKLLESQLAALAIRRQKELSVPTGVVCSRYDKLRTDIVTLLNLQKHVQDREAVRDHLRTRAAQSPGGMLPPGSLASAVAAVSAQPPPSPLSSPSIPNTPLAASLAAPFTPIAASGDMMDPATAAALAAAAQKKKLERRTSSASTRSTSITEGVPQTVLEPAAGSGAEERTPKRQRQR